jgi:Fanconi-associated nuclease 1
LKDHAREAQVLEALLGQRYWRRRKRGAWYDRRALLQTKYLCREDGIKHEPIFYEAMAGMREALNDEDTGLGR